MSEELEVICNLWDVRDEEGIIYSLRAKAYVERGSEEAKLNFLRQRALLDYLIAEPFEIPKRFHASVVGQSGEATVMPVCHVDVLPILDSPIAIFEDALKALEDRFPAQSDIAIPQNPLVCTTVLMQNARGIIEPRVERTVRY